MYFFKISIFKVEVGGHMLSFAVLFMSSINCSDDLSFITYVSLSLEKFQREFQLYYKMISIDKTGHCKGVCVCVREVGVEQNAIFLPSDDVRP